MASSHTVRPARRVPGALPLAAVLLVACGGSTSSTDAGDVGDAFSLTARVSAGAPERCRPGISRAACEPWATARGGALLGLFASGTSA